MNSAEQNVRLKIVINEVTKAVRDTFMKNTEFKNIVKTLNNLEDQANTNFKENPFDTNKLKNDFFAMFFEEVLNGVEKLVNEFRVDLDLEIYNATKSRAAKLETKYSDLHLVANRFSYKISKYKTIEEFITSMNNAKLELKKYIL